MLFAANSAMAQVTPVIVKSFGAATVPLGGTTTLQFVITNTTALTNVSFTDNLPAGLVVATPNGLTTTCPGGTITAVAGSGAVSLTGLALQAVFGCAITVNVTSTALGLQTNSVTVSDAVAGAGNTSVATITVVAPGVLPPTVTKAFGAATVPVNGTTTLAFTVSNPNAVALTGVAFTDTLPAGLVVSTPNGLTGSCGAGTITATAGSGAVTLAGATLAGNASCTFGLNVTPTAARTFNNVTGAVSSTQSGVGGVSNTAVLVGVAAPAIIKTFGATNIDINGVTSLTFTLANPNAAVALTGVAFTDTLPAGLAIDIPTAAASTCAGALTAAGGTAAISLTGGTIAANSTCTISLNVFGLTNGIQTNVTSGIASTNGGTGLATTAALTINPIIDPEEAFQVGYAANLSIGDSIVNITNTGTLTVPGTPMILATTGNICANVYTFDAAEELVSCCSCLVTPNGLNSLSARSDLISNTLTAGVPTSIVIKLVASRPLALNPDGTGGTCNASSPTPLTVTPGMRAWGTTLHSLPTTPVTFGVTETPFHNSPLSVAELTKVTVFCGFIQANGSGFGICKSCRIGGLGGASK